MSNVCATQHALCCHGDEHITHKTINKPSTRHQQNTSKTPKNTKTTPYTPCTVPGGLVEGDVRVNGHPLDEDALRRVVGYVEQVDALDPFSTVKEAVRHAARTTLPKEIALAIVDQHVEQVRGMKKNCLFCLGCCEAHKAV